MMTMMRIAYQEDEYNILFLVCFAYIIVQMCIGLYVCICTYTYICMYAYDYLKICKHYCIISCGKQCATYAQFLILKHLREILMKITN